MPGACNRIVTVSGVLFEVLAGVSEVLQQVMSHPRAAQLVDLPFPFHSARGYAGALSRLLQPYNTVSQLPGCCSARSLTRLWHPGHHTHQMPFTGSAAGDWQQPGFMHSAGGPGVASLTLGLPDVRATSDSVLVLRDAVERPLAEPKSKLHPCAGAGGRNCREGWLPAGRTSAGPSCPCTQR